MKQTFSLEIEVPEVDNLYFVPFILEGMISEKLLDTYGKSLALMRVRVKKQIEEQSVERPILQDEMINLLKRASQTIYDYERDDKLDSLWTVAEEIDKYIEDTEEKERLETERDG